MKNIRMFLIYMTNLETFDKINIFEFGRRIFLILLYSLHGQIPVEEVIQMFVEYPLDCDLPKNFIPTFDDEVTYFKKLWQISEFFRK